MSAQAGVRLDDYDGLRTEYRATQAAVDDALERARRLRRLADEADQEAERGKRAMSEIGSLLGFAPQLSMDALDERLRGRRLQEIAIQVLVERHGTREPIHYRRWYDLLREAGHLIGGKDPVASFLATVSRAPDVERVGGRSGLYLVRRD